MIVKAIYKDEKHDYFKDKTTDEKVENQIKRTFGDIFECSDDLAEERIEKGLVVEATDEEARQYVDSLETINEDDAIIKALNDCTIDELKQTIIDEDIPFTNEETKEEFIKIINKTRDERLKQLNNEEIPNLEELSFKELQQLAKSKNLKYVGVSKENLIKSINETITE